MNNARLEVNDGLGQRVVPLTKDLLAIGRRTESDLRLVGSDVSREHAEIVKQGDDWILRDVSGLGPPLVELPFGGPGPRW